MADGRPLAREQMLRAAGAGWSAGGRPLPHRVLASWQRSEEYGVPLESVSPVYAGTVDDESLFYTCGVEVLGSLVESLCDEPVSLMLTDGEGLVLDRRCSDAGLLRALDDVHLAPGFSYAEREVGTSGLGLALADRAPSLVRAEEHYSLSLCGYTCAAAPVLDPVTGRVEGSVNLTTWSRTSSGLLLAVAQSAAAGTAALMQARGPGAARRPAAAGGVFRVEPVRREPGAGTLTDLSGAWTETARRCAECLAGGRVTCVVGEVGSGRATLAAQALRHVRPRTRILNARAPAPRDAETWLSLWTPELAKPDTCVVVSDVDALPSWAAQHLRDAVTRARTAAAGPASAPLVAVTAADLAAVPSVLRPLVDAVVVLAPLRERPDDVLPLAAHLARRARGRDVGFTPRAGRALRDHPWTPGNVRRLAEAVGAAAQRADVVDLEHLPADVVSGPGRRLTRLEAVEREEIVRALTRSGATVKSAAAALGMGRATIYRKMSYYDIRLPGRDKP